jgi:PAS domain S-box-containing protein
MPFAQLSFEAWGINGTPFWGLPANWLGYGIVLVYVAVLATALFRNFSDFAKLRQWQWGLLIGLLLVSPITSTALQLRFPGTAAPPGLAFEPPGPSLALLNYAPLAVAAGLLGPGPTLVVGLLAGLARGGWDTYQITTVFGTALIAWMMSWLIWQDYRGRLPRLARFPLIAALGAALFGWGLSFFSFLANSSKLDLVGLDYVFTQWSGYALPLFGELLLGGIVGVLVMPSVPATWAPRKGNRPPPYDTSLNKRLLFAILPLSLGVLIIVLFAILRIANSVATDLIVDQMGRSAKSVADTVPYFAQTGQSILNALALDSHLQDPDPDTVQGWLAEQNRSIAFFRYLAVYDPQGKLIAAYPADGGPAQGLTSEETAALGLDIPQTITIYPHDPRNEKVQVSFIVPVMKPNSQTRVGMLLGRTNIDDNPMLKPAIDQLQALTANNGQGFILDEQDRIIYPLDQVQVLQTWSLAEAPAEPLTTDVPRGVTYRDRAPSNARQLVYYLPVEGFPWAIVILMPNDVVLSQATKITTPVIILLTALGVVITILILLLTSRITSPLQTLARATATITQGDFNRPVKVVGDDEVGRLGVAFERMRERLRARLGELNLLLKVSEGIAGTLDLDKSMPPLLDSALTTIGGNGARLVIPQNDGSLKTFTAGDLARAMAPLDSELLGLARNEDRPVVLENLARARAVLDVSRVASQVQAMIALPLRQEVNFLGVLWIGFGQPHSFSESEINFVSTLAGQAAVAISNASLYEASEGGRQQLDAILASSPDAVIVTDRHERILLINPAAATTFGVDPGRVNGRPLIEAINRPELTDAIRNPQAGTPRQLAMDDGSTLFASASPIAAASGDLIGHVIVLRDVTYFKQLDELKSEFVATVSHDLRVPLTFMRGYATMLPMVGQLNPKQGEFASKIVVGIEQMSELIEDLLDMNRIEAGVGLAREACTADELVTSAVTPLRNNAANKNITLTTDLAPALPALSGDRTLLRQAISNLVDNAIKYTPSGGRVRVFTEQRDGSVIVGVQDNGIGIAPTDQLRLFEKFFRVKQRDTMGIKGSGLGLAIVKSIVERHGGRIWVESRLGQGSTFYVALPA